jgi:hypothetical protein
MVSFHPNWFLSVARAQYPNPRKKEAARATRLDENSPNGRLFALGSNLKIWYKRFHFFGLLCYTVKVMHLFWQKVLGYSLGDFFISSTGHPGSSGLCLNALLSSI